MDIAGQRAPIETKSPGRSDLPILTGILSAAFQTEPAFSFIIPDADERRRRLPKAFKVIAAHDMHKGRIFMTAGGEAATMWRTPGTIKDTHWDAIKSAIPYLAAFGGAIERGGRVAGSVSNNLPTEPCWYLHYAACKPEFQGKGYGGAAIRAGLAAVDRANSKAYLETADEANLAIYRALGFELVKNWQVPRGPKFWGMMRPARG